MNPSDNATLIDAGLEADANFKSALERVCYQPGMLLGLKATQTEQSYHRQHLNRHDYWLHGSGTVIGLRVTAKTQNNDSTDKKPNVKLHISPGIGVDGLGREVTVHEPYCIDLGAWLTSKFQTLEEKSKTREQWNRLIRDGYDENTKQLWLKVTMRYQEIPHGLQPVQAFDVNAGTDAVKPSMLQDNVLFELLAEHPNIAASTGSFFQGHDTVPAWSSELESSLSSLEQDRIKQAKGRKKEQLQLVTRLLHALPENDDALMPQKDLTAADLARTLLARITIQLTDSQELILSTDNVTVDNLARPFLFNATALAQLIHD